MLMFAFGDWLMIAGATWLSFWAMESIGTFTWDQISWLIALKGLFVMVIGWALRMYQIDWRYASIREAHIVLMTLLLADMLTIPAQLSVLQELSLKPFFVQSILTINGVMFLRMISRSHAFPLLRRRDPERGRRTLVIGAGASGQNITKELKERRTNVLNVIGLLDDKPGLQRMFVHGAPVIGTTKDLERIIRDRAIEVVVLAIPSLPYQERIELLKRIEKTGVESHALPMLTELASGKVSMRAIKEVTIEELLGREPVTLDTSGISSHLKGQTVLVTGAGGSIGSELCRQLLLFEPKRLVLVGHGENSIYLIERELGQCGYETEIYPVIGDVQDKVRLEEIFEKYRPQFVYHAAAHKHVPLMEENPAEAVKNNVFGTKNVVDVADAFGVKRFVLISTDKAVNPTSVMGATKRIAEMVVQEKARTSDTLYAVVRFGNVLGSRGSVIPLFKDQIAKGGPVTVTDPEMRRYFMTIPEASRLVIQASVLAEGGEVFVLDMGEPVKIVDLAKRLIELSGFTTEQIQIRFTGMRKGEKMYEELLADSEHTSDRVFDKIFVGCTRPFETAEPILGAIRNMMQEEELLSNFLLYIANSQDTDWAMSELKQTLQFQAGM